MEIPFVCPNLGGSHPVLERFAARRSGQTHKYQTAPKPPLPKEAFQPINILKPKSQVLIIWGQHAFQEGERPRI